MTILDSAERPAATWPGPAPRSESEDWMTGEQGRDLPAVETGAYPHAIRHQAGVGRGRSRPSAHDEERAGHTDCKRSDQAHAIEGIHANLPTLFGPASAHSRWPR